MEGAPAEMYTYYYVVPGLVTVNWRLRHCIANIKHIVLVKAQIFTPRALFEAALRQARLLLPHCFLMYVFAASG